MRELNPDRGVLAPHEGDQRLEAFGLGLVPDAEIELVDQADFLDAGGLDKHQAKTAERVPSQMHVMKHAAGRTGIGAVMHHRRHHQAIFQRQAADVERLEQQGACGTDAGGRLVHGWPLA
jgi:hypothetical protein